MNITAKDVISSISYKAYKKYPIMNVSRKKNNFFFMGYALRILLCGGKLEYTQNSIQDLKQFVEDTVMMPGRARTTRKRIL